jgi:hypothetical protein
MNYLKRTFTFSHSWRYFAFPAIIVLCVVWVDRDFLNLQVPLLLSNRDNLDIVYPLFNFFITGLKHGHIEFYQPFQWAGTRLFGDPNFQINIVEVVTGALFGTKAIFESLNVMYLVERTVAALGMYALIGAVCPALPRPARAALALLYVFSYGYLIAEAFPTASVHFATAPWLLFVLAANTRLPTAAGFAVLTALLFVQFSYGQLQFTIYLGWLLLSFVVFYLPRTEKLRAVVLLGVAAFAAMVLSAYYVVPLVDNLFFAFGAGGRVAHGLNVPNERVPIFYLVRLFVPQIFGGSGVPWWPIWKDGWTSWESFSAFQGIALSLLAVFGLFLRRVPLYFKLLYLWIALAVAFRPTLYILYVLNLGTSVPYGRQTVLLGLVAPIIAAFTLMEIIENRKVAAAFAVWCGLCCAGLFAIYMLGFPQGFVQYVFAVLKHSFPYAYHPGDAQRFYALHAQALQNIFAAPALFAGLATLVALAIVGARKWREWLPSPQTSTFLATLLCLLSLGETVALYQQARLRANNEPDVRYSLDTRHPAEEALIAAAQVNDGPVAYRVHPDIYFKEQRDGTDETFRVRGAHPQDNRFRTLANFLAGEDVPVTTGYSSLIPEAQRFTELMMWNPGNPAMERAIGYRTKLHPGLLGAFAIKWVLRHQPSLIAKLKGLPDWSDDPWEQRFLASAKLIYSDDAYRLYEYRDARPAIDIPDRVAFGQDAVATLTALEQIDKPWLPTAALPKDAIGTLPPALGSGIVEEHGIPVLHQAGKVLTTAGEAGHWTKISVQADKPAIVLLGVKYDKWWHVSVNGHPAPLIRANSIFAAVQVPDGKSEIIVELRPWSAWIGLFVSGVTLAVLLALLAGFAAVRFRGLRVRRTASTQ